MDSVPPPSTELNSRQSPAATVFAYALVLLTPVLAWLVWVSGSGAKASDAMHVAWFATVALGCVTAGVFAPRQTLHLALLAVVAVISTIATLFWWWAGQDDSGLFIIGVVLATPLVALASVPLLLLGRLVRLGWRHGQARGLRTPRS